MNYLFQQWSLDFVGPLPRSQKNNTYILVAVESFSRWPIAIATQDTSARTTADFLYHNIFCLFGLPTHILTDNASSFDNEIIDKLLYILQVNHQYTSPYRPTTNGRVEHSV